MSVQQQAILKRSSKNEIVELILNEADFFRDMEGDLTSLLMHQASGYQSRGNLSRFVIVLFNQKHKVLVQC